MGDATTLLFGLDGFRVVSVTREHKHKHEHDEKHDGGVRQVVRLRACWCSWWARRLTRRIPFAGAASGSAGSVSTTVEVLLDPPSYQPLAHVDSEIVNRALDLQAFSGRSVQVVTADDWSAGRRGRG